MQDFEGLTPNLLARTIETVEGGGVVVMLLSTLRSLKQLFTLTMDVHSRLKTESHQDVRGVRHCPYARLRRKTNSTRYCQAATAPAARTWYYRSILAVHPEHGACWALHHEHEHSCMRAKSGGE